MKLSQTFSGAVFVLLAAALGIGLIYLPGWIIDKYEMINALGSVWGILYLIPVIVGLTPLIGSAGWIVWKLWGTSLAKQIKCERRNKNPSEVSHSQNQFQYDENRGQI